MIFPGNKYALSKFSVASYNFWISLLDVSPRLNCLLSLKGDS